MEDERRFGLDSASVRLSRDEEIELAALIANGDREARNRIVQANLRLVVKIARDFQGRGLDLDDLIGEGNLGLIRAADEFDPRFGVRFSTYAAYWIKEKIRSAVMNTTSTIRLPAYMFRLLVKWRRAELTLRRQRGEVPTFDEVASVLDLSPKQKSMVAQARTAKQLMAVGMFPDEAGDGSYREPRDRQGASEDKLELEQEWSVILRRMERLDTREMAILSWRFGLHGEVLTLVEIGRRFGVTRECVRNIRNRALRKLRNDQSDRADHSKAGSRWKVRRGRELSAGNGHSQWSDHTPESSRERPHLGLAV